MPAVDGFSVHQVLGLITYVEDVYRERKIPVKIAKPIKEFRQALDRIERYKRLGSNKAIAEEAWRRKKGRADKLKKTTIVLTIVSTVLIYTFVHDRRKMYKLKKLSLMVIIAFRFYCQLFLKAIFANITLN